MSNSSHRTVENLFPYYIFAPTTGESTGIAQLTGEFKIVDSLCGHWETAGMRGERYPYPFEVSFAPCTLTPPANDGYVSCVLSLSSSNSSGSSPEWWTLEEVNDLDPVGIELLVYSDRVAAGVFSSVASIGYVYFGVEKGGCCLHGACMYTNSHFAAVKIIKECILKAAIVKKTCCCRGKL